MLLSAKYPSRQTNEAVLDCLLMQSTQSIRIGLLSNPFFEIRFRFCVGAFRSSEYFLTVASECYDTM